MFEAVGETIRKTVALNDAFFGNSINVISHFFRAAWTLLWAIVSLVVAVATLCLNAVAGLVSLVPQVAGFAVRVVAAILQSLVGLFSFLTDAFVVVKAFCYNFALFCHDILTQIETLLSDTRSTLQWTSDALQTCLESTAESFVDLASLVSHLRYASYLLICAIFDRLLSLVLFVLLLPVRLLSAIPLSIYILVIGAPLSYRLTRLTWAWMRTQNCVSSTPVFQAVDAAKTFVESRCVEPARIVVLTFSSFMYSKVLNPVKLWALIASQAMVDQVYVPFLRDLSSLARHCIRLYVEFLFLVGGFCFGSVRRLVGLLYGSLLLFASALYYHALVSTWRRILRHSFYLDGVVRRWARDLIQCGEFVTSVTFSYLRAPFFRISQTVLDVWSRRRGRGAGGGGGAGGGLNAQRGNIAPAPSPSCSASLPSSSSSSSSSATNRSPGDDAALKALRRELSEADERQRCVVCLESLKSMLILPCRHACLCRPCAVEIINHADVNQRICPLCRTLMHEVLHVFM